MKLFPASALQLIEFDKIKTLLAAYCNTGYAKNKAEQLRIHTRIDFIAPELQQSHECKLLIQNHLNFPSEYVFNLEKEIRMLNISGAVLSGSQIMLIKGLTESIQKLFRWFNEGRAISYPALH